MKKNKMLVNQPKIAAPKESRALQKIKAKLRKILAAKLAAQLAAQKSAVRLVDTTGMVDRHKS